MRLFQNNTYGRSYLRDFARRFPQGARCSYKERLGLLLQHGNDGPHILLPVFTDSEDVRYTVADDEVLQKQWAKEHGLKSRDHGAVLLAQIEDHQTEVFYNMSPLIYDSAFVRRLPGCVRKTICWRAAPLGGADLSAYDLRVANFEGFLTRWRNQGMRSSWFSPSHVPAMSAYAQTDERPVDICFVGSYGRLHRKRNELLRQVARHAGKQRICFHLIFSHWTRLWNSVPFGRELMPDLAFPLAAKGIVDTPIFGNDLYRLFGRSKIVINAAIDMAGNERGNMRCFEAMGCGAIMLSDVGVYPAGMVPGVHFETYKDLPDAISQLLSILSTYEQKRGMGLVARENMETNFSKERQWNMFRKLVSDM